MKDINQAVSHTHFDTQQLQQLLTLLMPQGSLLTRKKSTSLLAFKYSTGEHVFSELAIPKDTAISQVCNTVMLL